MKKFIAMVLSMALVAGLSIGGTVAYLKAEDSDVNVMTMGSVKIDQQEYERDLDAGTKEIDGKTSYVLKKFTQDKPLYPATESTNFGAGNYEEIMVRMAQVGSQGSMQVFETSNAVDKFVTVKNTGKSDAYVRTLVALEIGSISVDNFGDVIRTSAFMTDKNVWSEIEVGVVAVNGTSYYVWEYIYNGGAHLGGVHENGVLPAGATTYPSLCQVFMTSAATNEDCVKLDGNNNGKYDILVLSQAAQTEGFDNAQEALNTAFGKVNAANAAVWFESVLAANTDDATENTTPAETNP